MLGQTRVDASDTDEPGAGDAMSKTVLEHVVTSNRTRERALRQSKMLSMALETDSASTEVAKTIRQLELENLNKELAQARSLAERRSGARGLKARQALIAKEKQVEDATIRLQSTKEDANMVATEEEVKTAVAMLEEVQLSLKAMDSGSTEAKARTTLLGLGFEENMIDGPFVALSGGWRSRCDLACCLTQKTDVLLLDEPTNFLDLPAVLWLQHYLTSELSNTSVLVVTHDRDFADAVAEELLLLRLVPPKSLETFKGNISEYESEKRRQIRRMTRMKDAADKKAENLQDQISSNVRAAKKTGDDKKLKQAAAKKKKLEERSGLEINAQGNRFKLSRDRAGFQLTKRAEIEIPELDPLVSISFPGSPEDLRFPGPLLSFEKVTFKYPKTKEPIIKDVDLVLHPGERVGLAGLNGAGKSTIIKLAMAAADGTSPTPTNGTITVHPKVRIGYYSQHAVEELEDLGRKDPGRTALSHMLDLGQGALNEQEVRGLLAGLGLKGNFVSDVPLQALSGGQRVRLALAQVVWSVPHLLVLDEVTTHLDSDTITALIEALKSWKGALLVVTHDRFFMRCVVEGEKPDRGHADGDASDDSSDEDGDDNRSLGVVYRVRNSVLKKLEGGMAKYEELVLKSLAKQGLIG